ncbi:MAG: aspartate carbamoyltransferase [Bacteroides sp.]|nr:aspartate carbamoyltransferase [Bacillota bacterium]MCM1455640.1 aspartate carbamoyltransferase [Bacteroides sp.]
MRNLIDITDFSVDELYSLIAIANDIIANPTKYAEACKGKKLATLFFEPSTRTRLSFEAAMLELGGSVIGFSEASSSSAAKGESIADTAKIVSCYADIIAMRSPIEGAALVAANNATIPVINAGDGGHCHPTQTLADLLTIFREKGDFDNLTVGFCGDLKYGRTVHSLLGALARYKNVKAALISPTELRLPEYVKQDVLGKVEIVETASLDDAIPALDVLYMTRIQRERFDDRAEYERLKDSYVLTVDKLKAAKPDMIILHPLPRVNEISVKVDDDSRACYFKQALYGKYMRMALILRLLEEAKRDGSREKRFADDVIFGEYKCKNPRCATAVEQELEHAVKVSKDGVLRCCYCDKEI